MRKFTALIIGLILAALLFGLARPAAAAGETTALQAFIDAQAATIAALNTRVAAAEATEVASQKRIAALEAWVKAYVPVVQVPNVGPPFASAWIATGSMYRLGTTPARTTFVLGTAAPTGRPILGMAPTGTGILGTPPVPQGPHP